MPLRVRPLLRLRRRRSRQPLLAPLAIGFSLTFALAGISVLAGWVPEHLVPGGIGTSILLLMVPLVALLFAIVAEVVRHEVGLKGPQPASAEVAVWRPGVGEG